METWLREVLETVDRAWNRTTPMTPQATPIHHFTALPPVPATPTHDDRCILEALNLPLPDLNSSYMYPGFTRPIPHNEEAALKALDAVDTIRKAVHTQRTLIVQVTLLCHAATYEAMNPRKAFCRVLHALSYQYGITEEQCNIDCAKYFIPSSMQECMNVHISVSEEL